MFEDDFPFPGWDMLVPWRVCQYINYSTICFALSSHWEQRFRCMDFMMTTLQRACRQVCEHVLIPRCESHSPHSYCQKQLSKNDLRLTVSIIWRNDEAAKWKKNFSKTHWDHYTSQTAGDRLSTPTVERLCTRYAQRGQPVCSHLVGRCRSHKRHPCHRTSDDESGEIEEQSTGLKIHEDFIWFHEDYDYDMLNFYESRKSDGWRWHHVCYLLVLWVLLDDW